MASTGDCSSLSLSVQNEKIFAKYFFFFLSVDGRGRESWRLEFNFISLNFACSLKYFVSIFLKNALEILTELSIFFQ